MLLETLDEYLKSEVFRVMQSLDKREQYISIYTPVKEMLNESEIFAIFKDTDLEFSVLLDYADSNITREKLEHMIMQEGEK